VECKDNKKQMAAMNMNPKAYVLRFAEDDGTPDDDLPGISSSYSSTNICDLMIPSYTISIGEDARNRSI
jgi:hypothetical protein